MMQGEHTAVSLWTWCVSSSFLAVPVAKSSWEDQGDRWRNHFEAAMGVVLIIHLLREKWTS
jgi:hypothetical protein